MGYFYIDESIHDNAGFIIVACVYSETDLNDTVQFAIKSCGFNADEHEFKSAQRFAGNHAAGELRDQLKTILITHCKLAAVVIPRNKREEIGPECVSAIKQFITVNDSIEKPVHVYFDQGMFSGRQKNELNTVGYFDAHLEQDSKYTRGLQLADLAAHMLAIQLKDGFGLITKKIKAGENSGYDPDMEVTLAFEMWASTRHIFFTGEAPEISDDVIAMATLPVEPHGLFVSEYCDEKLARIARKKFANMYLGCIH